MLRGVPSEVEPDRAGRRPGRLTGTSTGCSTRRSSSCCCASRPSAFDDNRGAWGWRWPRPTRCGATPRGRASTPTRPGSPIEEQLRATPEDAQLHALHGVALAYLGRKAEAIRRASAAWRSCRSAKDAYSGAYIQHQLARIYLLVGEPEKALDQLEPLLKIPYYLSPGWLRIDPTFAPLRGNPRFERLVNGS